MLLQKKRSHALEILMKLEDDNTRAQLSLPEIKSRITGKTTEGNVLTFCQEIMAELEQAGKIGNARVYKTLHNSLATHVTGKDISFKQLTFKWLKVYEAWYLAGSNNKKKNSLNGLSVNLRTLRALYNRAIKHKIVEKDYYPFDDYKIQHEKTRKRAIPHQDLSKLKNTEPQTDRQRRAKDYFLMSFYLMGTSFIDLAFLKVEDIKSGRIEYKRKKTGRLHSIKITPPLLEILNRYTKEKSADDFILNIIQKEQVFKKQYAAARDEMRRYNKALKGLATLAGIEDTITSYTARHTFATTAKFKGVPVAAISDALGHSDVKTTQIYLDQFDNDTMDAYNAFIIGED